MTPRTFTPTPAQRSSSFSTPVPQRPLSFDEAERILEDTEATHGYIEALGVRCHRSHVGRVDCECGWWDRRVA